MKHRIHMQDEAGNEFTVIVERDGATVTVQRDSEVHTFSVSDVERIYGAASEGRGSGWVQGGAAAGRPTDSAPRSSGSDSSSGRTGAERTGAVPGAGAVAAPMTGVIKELIVSAGDSVEAGERVLIMEAMKMDIEVHAPRRGKVTKLLVDAGTNVNEGQTLMEIE